MWFFSMDLFLLHLALQQYDDQCGLGGREGHMQGEKFLPPPPSYINHGE
jgi:hypothetical protein